MAVNVFPQPVPYNKRPIPPLVTPGSDPVRGVQDVFKGAKSLTEYLTRELGFVERSIAAAGRTPGRTVTADTIATDSDGFIAVDATDGAVTITLPSAFRYGGRIFYVKKVDASANAVTIVPDGTDTIDGGASVVLGGENESVELYAQAEGWQVLSQANIVPPGAVTGSGTVNTIPLWTGTTALGNSLLSQSGGTVTVAANLTVQGNTTLGNATSDTVTATGSLTFNGPTTATLYFGVAGLGNDLVNLAVRRVVNSDGGGNFVGQKARGTVGAETFAQAFDNIAVFAGRAWDGSGYTTTTANINIRAFENQSATAQGGIIDFNVTRVGTKILNTSMSLEANGTLVLYGDTTNAGLQAFWTGGSVSSPAYPTNGQALGYFGVGGWTGSGTVYAASASVNYQATQLWTSAARGTRMIFTTTPNGTTTPVASWDLGQEGILSPLAAVSNAVDVGRSTALVRRYYVGTAIIAGATDTVNIGSLGLGMQSLVIEHNASRATGVLLNQTLTATASPRLMFNNSTDWAGAANVIYQTASNQLSFATGGTIGSSSGTVRWNYDAGAVFPQTTDAMTLGKPAQVWSHIYGDDGTFSGQLTFNLENRTSDPGSPSTGRMWLRTDL